MLQGLAINRVAILVVPALLFLVVFFGYPVGEILGRSFTDVTAPESGWLGNYEWFFSTAVNVKILLRTFATAAIVTSVCLLFAFPYAYLMTVVNHRWRLFMLGVLLVPFWTSLMVRNYAWIVWLQDGGIINDALEAIGIGRAALIDTLQGVIIGMAQVLLPFMVLPLYAILQGIDRSLLLAASGLGAKPSVAFVRVYLPLALPGVLAGCLLVFVLSLGFFLAPALLGSPQESLLSQYIVVQTSQLLAWGHGGAMAGTLLVVTVVLIWLASLLVRRANRYSTAGRGDFG